MAMAVYRGAYRLLQRAGVVSPPPPPPPPTGRGPRVVSAGHPVLRKIAARVDPAKLRDPETAKTLAPLVGAMIALMREQNGVGIAAPQLGHSLQVIVVEVEPQFVKETRREKPKLLVSPVPLTVLINPVLRPVTTETVTHREGCLSVPGYTAHVKRFRRVAVSAIDMQGDPVQFEASNYYARILQHEVDHLNGKLYCDHMVSHSFSLNAEAVLHPPPRIDLVNDGVHVT